MKMPLLFIRVHVIFLVSLCCVHTQMFRSSYFTISSQEDLDAEEDFSLTTNVHDEYSCASLCTSTTRCSYALFDKDSKKCSLVKATKKLKLQNTEKPDSEKILLEKVTIAPNRKQDCASVEMDKTCSSHAKNKTTRTCGDILRENSSSPTGFYNITVSNVTWQTWCRMNGIIGCGGGVWELVMRIKEKDTFTYDSRRWSNKESLNMKYISSKGKQLKLPGYWLRNFTKICVTIQFLTNVSRNATFLLVNHTAQSLYSVLHDGVKKMLPADLTTIETPPNIDKRCLTQGFNLLGPWSIKSRIGVVSQPRRCVWPNLVRGVGIGVQGHPKMSCGEVIIRDANEPVTIYPAVCRVYIQ